MKYTNKVAFLDVYETEQGEIAVINPESDYDAIYFDECMAEKLCKAIMKVAKQIRERENE